MTFIVNLVDGMSERIRYRIVRNRTTMSLMAGDRRSGSTS